MLRIALLCGLLSVNAWANAEADSYNRVDFQVEASREVANDMLEANMTVEIQDKQPDRVSQQINTALNDALKKASAFDTVKASSGNQNTYPVYGKNNQIDAWRGHGEIRLRQETSYATYDRVAIRRKPGQTDAVIGDDLHVRAPPAFPLTWYVSDQFAFRQLSHKLGNIGLPTALNVRQAPTQPRRDLMPFRQ